MFAMSRVKNFILFRERRILELQRKYSKEPV